MWLKLAIILALALAVVLLATFLTRDFKRGIVHTHLGTYRRDDSPGSFWFWIVSYFVLMASAICAALEGLKALG
jgi:regulator of protease activity HflC (stomatin/prohibitin superfamily)